MRIGRIEEDFKNYCKKIDEKKKIALPIPLFKPRNWRKLEQILNKEKK